MTVLEVPAPRSELDPLQASSRVVHWVLRASVCACFVGHGAFGLRQKLDWLPFFRAFGIDDPVALTLMPIVGSVDILFGLLVLYRPMGAALVYTAFWGVFTACLRPLVGMSFFEVLERGGNFGPSLALLFGVSGATWLEPRRGPALDSPLLATRSVWILRVTTFLLMLGHGGLALLAKPQLIGHWASVGLVNVDATGALYTQAMGAIEVALAFGALLRPTRMLALGILGWKVATEALFLTAGDPIWEFIERAGSYGAPLALFYVLSCRATAEQE